MITQEYKDAQSVKNAQLRGLLDRLPIVDHADRRKKLRPHDDGYAVIIELMKGAIVVTASVFVLWLALGAA
jgi:hypothetical protein